MTILCDQHNHMYKQLQYLHIEDKVTIITGKILDQSSNRDARPPPPE